MFRKNRERSSQSVSINSLSMSINSVKDHFKNKKPQTNHKTHKNPKTQKNTQWGKYILNKRVSVLILAANDETTEELDM